MNDTDIQKEAERPGSGELIGHLIVLQIKLILDGLRDATLIPVSFVAAIGGLLMHKDDPWVWYREVLIWGRASDHWIDLFDMHKDAPPPNLEELAEQTRERLGGTIKPKRSADDE